MDKPKRKAKPKRKRQDVILQRRFMILTALVVMILLVPWLVPLQMDYLKPQMALRTLGMLLSGTLLVPIAVWLDWWGLLDDPSLRLSAGWVITLGLLPIVIWYIGWLLRIIWRARWSLKIWAGSLVAVNLFCGLLVLLVSDPRVHNAVTCEKTLSDDLSIRIVSYQEFSNGLQRPDHFLFFLTSDDQGQSWDQVFRTTNGKRATWFCSNFYALDDTFFLTWQGPYVIVSHDGGHSWMYHDWDRGWHGKNIIREVVFEDRDQGYAVVDIYPYNDHYEVDFTAPSETITYHTTDGGRTWSSAESIIGDDCGQT